MMNEHIIFYLDRILSLIDIKSDSLIGQSLGLTRLVTRILRTKCPINCLKLLLLVVVAVVVWDDLVVAGVEEIIE